MGAITAVCDNSQTDFFFFLGALFRTVAQDLGVLRFPYAHRGIKEETDVLLWKIPSRQKLARHV